MSRGEIILVTIASSHFYAGIDVRRRRFAPIIGYMHNWGFRRVVDYCKAKGWRVGVVRIGERI